MKNNMEHNDLLINDRKVYVDVLEERDREGRIFPRSFVWEDGRRYEIDRVLEICRAASLVAGGAGMRYTVKIGNHERYMFLEDDTPSRWFVPRGNA